MPLETGTTISSLNKDWPLNTDQVLQGDDHLRLLKSVLLSQFNGGADGLSEVVNANAEEMNFLVGVTSNIQDQLDALDAKEEFESGTVMVFHQATAPTGWTQLTSAVDNKMLRVTNGPGGGSGGSTGVTDWQGSFTHAHATSGHELSIAEMPAHGHFIQDDESPVQVQDTPVVAGNQGAGFTQQFDLVNLQKTKDEGGGAEHDHGDTALSADPAFDPDYLDIIIAEKDA